MQDLPVSGMGGDASFCLALPKIELHAHLNGSIRAATLNELSRGSQEWNADSLAGCMKVFEAVKQFTNSHEVVTRITREVVEDFEEDGVVYLELRSTPKAIGEMTKKSYVEAVLQGLEQFAEENSSSRIIARLILSINRDETCDQALETVQLACEFHSRGVVGVDLSGNPSAGEFSTWVPALQLAKSKSLGVTIHAGEVVNYTETSKILDFGPDRLGHLCFIGETNMNRVMNARVPLELCLTSNLVTQSVPSLEKHHFREYYESGYPLVICTDDKGLFSTTLSREYALAAETFGLSNDSLLALAENAIEYAFCGQDIKNKLHMQFESFKQSLEKSVAT